MDTGHRGRRTIGNGRKYPGGRRAGEGGGAVGNDVSPGFVRSIRASPGDDH